MPPVATHEDLLVPIYRAGELVYELPTLAASRERTFTQLKMINATSKRLVNPHTYPAGIERKLADEKARLIEAARISNRI